MRLAVALGWHSLAFEELLDLVRHAESAGFEAAFVDGDVSQIPGRGEADVLDGWTVTAALLARTERIQIGSIRLVHHWNAARLAQAAATLERIAPGRLRFLISIGGQPADRCFGLPFPSARERIAWLDETLQALRRLWRGDEVTAEGASSASPALGSGPARPRGGCPSRSPPPVLGCSRWSPPTPTSGTSTSRRSPPASGRPSRSWPPPAAARPRSGRDSPLDVDLHPAPWGPGDAEIRDEFRRLNPWFRSMSDEQLGEAIVAGSPAACRRRIAEIAESSDWSCPSRTSPASLMTQRGVRSTRSAKEKPSLTRILGEPTLLG